MAQYNSDGSVILFYDQKGYEDPYRKHHTSSITRDIWTYNVADSTYTKITSWKGEDRNPVWHTDQKMYFLSERDGSFNVWKSDVSPSAAPNAKQVSHFTTNPVRDLSISNDGMLCYWYNGEIYTQLDPMNRKK